jgi:hypothetical protein
MVDDTPTGSATDLPIGSMTGDLRVELWTRQPVSGPRTAVIDRLRRLRTAGVLTDFTVNTWPEEIPVGEQRDRSDLLETIERFQQWARGHGLGLQPALETRPASLLVGADETVLVTPMVLVSVYDDDELVGVFPCSHEHRVWTVTAVLDALDPETDGKPPSL